MQRLIVLFLLLCCKSICAQVPVHQEPRHRPVFSDDTVRILNVKLPPGDTSLYHLHHTPSVFIFLTSSGYGSQLWDGEPVSGRFTAGRILFEDLAAPHTRVHRVWNTGSDTMHVMDIELLRADTGFPQNPISLPQLELAVDTPLARVYRVELNAGEKLDLRTANRSLVLVSMKAEKVQLEIENKREQRALQPGSYFRIYRGRKFLLTTTSATTTNFVLLELPSFR